MAPIAERRAVLRALVDDLVAEARNLRVEETDVQRLLAEAWKRHGAARDRRDGDE
jgi:hypothetical protein